jgi:hypothetical protein
MKESDVVSIAEELVQEFAPLLHIDPYNKFQVELTDTVGISDCIRGSYPATWKIRLNASQHSDYTDVQMSVINAVLTVLFREIPPSLQLDEVKSKLTHSLAQLTAPPDDFEQVEE